MPHVDAPLPRDHVIRRALRETTERLAREVAAPGSQAPAWTEFEWRVAMAAAVMHGLCGLMHARLRWQGPVVWQAFLEHQKHQCVLRQRRIAGLLAQLDDAGRAQGVPMLAMKGSAMLALGLFGEGERPMSDIDLLVRPHDRERTLQLLQAMGYVTDLEIARHACLRPANGPSTIAFGEHADNPVKIELHTRIYEALPVREVDITARAFPVDARDGINAYPSIAALMRHLLLHTANNLRTGSLRFIQLHDIAGVAARLDACDWETLLQPDADSRGPWWALPPLRLASRHFPGAIPASVMQRVERESRPLLRWSSSRGSLVDASLSAARIRALPGLSWSASVAEASALIVERLVPGQEGLAIRHHKATQAAFSGSSWTHASPAMKLLRWVLRRPLSPAATYSIRQALAYRPVDAAWSSSNRAAA